MAPGPAQHTLLRNAVYLWTETPHFQPSCMFLCFYSVVTPSQCGEREAGSFHTVHERDDDQRQEQNRRRFPGHLDDEARSAVGDYC